MAKKLFFLVIISLLFICGCIGSESEDEKEIKAVVYENINTLNEENLEATMDTIHPESKGYKSTKEVVEYLFETYDIHCELSKVKITELSETEAEVEVVQTCKKISGPEYNDNTTTAIHKLKKYNGEWKIYATTIKNIEYIN